MNGFFRKHAVVQILGCQLFMPDQRPCGIREMMKFRLCQLLTDKGLKRRIDVLTANLEQILFTAKPNNAFQLRVGIAGWHIGNRVHSVLFQPCDQRIQKRVLKHLRFFIARYAIAHIAQVRIGRYRTD